MDIAQKVSKKNKAKDQLISRRKYNYLKSQNKLSENERLEIEAYENHHTQKPIPKEQVEKIKNYYQKIKSTPEEREYHVTAKKLYEVFLRKFKSLEGINFILNDQTKNNLEPLIYYFAKNEKFFNCQNVHTNIKFGSKSRECKPSFNKGLLIIGDFGNGKTATMKAFKLAFEGMQGYSFGAFTANEVVEMYENLTNASEKDEYWWVMNRNKKYFDDVKTEREANNYGKANLFKDILEKRYERKSITYITCNYKSGHPNDISQALLEFAEKYGERVFDRLFHMFNIIEFKGKSFRR